MRMDIFLTFIFVMYRYVLQVAGCPMNVYIFLNYKQLKLIN